MAESFPRVKDQPELPAFDAYKPLKSALRFLVALLVLIIFSASVFKLFEYVHYQNTTYALEEKTLMGTTVEIKAYGKGVTSATKKAFDEMIRVARLINPKDPKSEVNLINSMAGMAPVAVSHNTFDIINRSLKISASSGGYFDISVGPLMALWNFNDPTGFLLPTEPQLKDALSHVGYKKIVLNSSEESVSLPLKGMRLDLGGIGKGYVLSIARNVLLSKGIQSGLISAGSSITCIGKRPDGKFWRVGIRSPREEEGLIGIISLAPGKAVSTSGDYEQFLNIEGKRYHHIIDAKTGYPGALSQSVTIIANDATLADALSTAVFLMGPVKGLKAISSFENVEALIVDSEGRIHKTPSFPLEQAEEGAI